MCLCAAEILAHGVSLMSSSSYHCDVTDLTRKRRGSVTPDIVPTLQHVLSAPSGLMLNSGPYVCWTF